MDANDDDDKQVRWSTLPKDVIPILINRLETRIDLLRFRSICRSWRYSSAASLSSPPLSLPNLPFPFSPLAADPRRGTFTAAATTVFLLQPFDEIPHRTTSHYLIKVEEDAKTRLVCPVSDLVQTRFPAGFSKEVNLLEFRISQVHNSYTFRNLELLNCKPIEAGLPFVKKIVVLGSNPDSRIVVVVYEMWDLDGRLAMLRVGDDSWTPIYTQHFVCDDIIVYKGNFYTVDRSGRAFVLDPNMNLIEIAPPPTNENGKKKKKHLVESIGDLLLVDKYFELHERNVYYYKDGKERVKSSNREMVSEMRVYRLNEDEHRWVEVRSLEDQILFVGDDCSYSVSAREFPGCRGNRVVYEDHAVASQIEEEDELFDGLWVYQIGVFNLGNGRVRSLATCPQLARIFWPPPSSSGCSIAENTDLKAKSVKETTIGNPTSSPFGGTLFPMSSTGRSSTFGSSASKVVGSITSFGSSSSATSSSIFGSTWQPAKSSTSTCSSVSLSRGPLQSFIAATNSVPTVFGSFTATSSTSTRATSSSQAQPVFSASIPVFMAASGNNDQVKTASGNSDQVKTKDCIGKDDPVKASTGFTFGTATPSVKIPFQYDIQQNQSIPQNPSQFGAFSGSVEFSIGGEFSFCSGRDKSNRKIVRVKHKNRRRRYIIEQNR